MGALIRVIWGKKDAPDLVICVNYWRQLARKATRVTRARVTGFILH